MVLDSPHTHTGFLEEFFTVSAALIFVFVGLALRRYLGSLKRSRPVHDALTTALKRRLRITKLKQFESLSEQLLSDAREMLQNTQGTMNAYPEARVLIPLFLDCKNYGQKLLSVQRLHHIILHGKHERRLKQNIYKINVTLYRIESLPRGGHDFLKFIPPEQQNLNPHDKETKSNAHLQTEGTGS